MWYVYIIECEKDGTLYTGITTDVNRRISEHNSGKGCKYTSSRGPVVLRALFGANNRSDASKEEARIKKLTKLEKLSLCESNELG